jgi:hypothetical protein
MRYNSDAGSPGLGAEFTWLLTTVVLMLGAARPMMAQSSSCMTNADTSARHIVMLTRIVDYDSTQLTQLGIPYHPSGGVSLVTDSVVCGAVISAYNALPPSGGDPRDVSRAYVFRIGTAAYAMVGEQSLDVYDLFDYEYHWLAGIAALN